MDKVFARFIEKLGNVIDRVDVPASAIERYQGKLPKLWLEYWAEHGWCGYGNGIFWIVNPQDYEGVVAAWLEGTELENRDKYHVIARSAFGQLYLWGERTGPSVTIVSVYSRCSIQDFTISEDTMDREVHGFLLTTEVEYNDLDNMFDRARKRLGMLQHDEMYGFVPAVMLGGSDTFENLKKVKAVEHLMILSQLAELEPYNFPDV
ncbi:MULTISPECIES: GAD-like domain-containing protein [Pseudomonas]|uniref:DUF1851 domain-containing protein n=1 Tax=Pseudomonas quercus TaxID=2722792 RepID=A0ABX0YG95_9PSED|nr:MULTISPECIES: GAD-like domain-containing protein [Pseudomonas]MBF7142673.1 DUF1851 domain-containing protein [Pseudomonas sp. LY10J]NJP01211.1 DUF1851 domain-containing protein [Pseudomonas quercus]